jgi:hypothetical protein
VLLAGCGDGRPRRVPVSGQVLIDGKPVTTGFVRLVPENDRVATGDIDSQGRFRLTKFDVGDGCVIGTHKVEVISFETLSPVAIRWLVPKEYRDASTSDVTATIDGPTDDLKIELSWKGGRPFVEQSVAPGDADPAAI